MLALSELLSHLDQPVLHTACDPATVLIDHVTADSRIVRPGTLFVAIQGGSLDGHRFLQAARQAGAVAALGTRSPAALLEQGLDFPAHLPYVQVSNSRQALAVAAAALKKFPSRALTVLGVTGTDGKTTTSSLLEAIFAAATASAADDPGAVGVITTVGARIRGQSSDTGFHVTTPDAPAIQNFLAQMRDAGCRLAVIESTSHGLDQARVAAVDFDVAIVTNITHEHLDYHGTREAYVTAKAKLFRMLHETPPKPGIARVAVLNADDEGSIDALRTAIREAATSCTFPVQVRTYGLVDKANITPPDLYATQVAYRPERTELVVHWWGGEFALTSPLIGEFNVYNVLAATTAALALGIEPVTIQAALAAFPGVLGRMERIDEGQDFLAVVDFAHTPISLERALTTLRQLVGSHADGTPGRLIAIFGSAGLRDRAKRYWMGEISGRLSDFTVITAEDPRTESLDEINAEIERGVTQFADSTRYIIIPDRSEAIQFAVNLARAGDVVAAFGKGHERSMCFGETEYPWSDQDAMRAALRQRRSQA